MCSSSWTWKSSAWTFRAAPLATVEGVCISEQVHTAAWTSPSELLPEGNQKLLSKGRAVDECVTCAENPGVKVRSEVTGTSAGPEAGVTVPKVRLLKQWLQTSVEPSVVHRGPWTWSSQCRVRVRAGVSNWICLRSTNLTFLLFLFIIIVCVRGRTDSVFSLLITV